MYHKIPRKTFLLKLPVLIHRRLRYASDLTMIHMNGMVVEAISQFLSCELARGNKINFLGEVVPRKRMRY